MSSLVDVIKDREDPFSGDMIADAQDYPILQKIARALAEKRLVWYMAPCDTQVRRITCIDDDLVILDYPSPEPWKWERPFMFLSPYDADPEFIYFADKPSPYHFDKLQKQNLDMMARNMTKEGGLMRGWDQDLYKRRCALIQATIDAEPLDPEPRDLLAKMKNALAEKRVVWYIVPGCMRHYLTCIDKMGEGEDAEEVLVFDQTLTGPELLEKREMVLRYRDADHRYIAIAELPDPRVFDILLQADLDVRAKNIVKGALFEDDETNNRRVGLIKANLGKA